MLRVRLWGIPGESPWPSVPRIEKQDNLGVKIKIKRVSRPFMAVNK